MRHLAMILFLLVTAGLVVLAIPNFLVNVQLSLFAWQTPPIPLGWLLLLAFFLGALMLYIISVASAWEEKRTLLNLRVRVHDLERQLATPSAQPTQVSPVPLPATNVPMPGMPGPDISDMTTLH